MAKTYTLQATLNTGHLIASDYMEPNWSNFLTWNGASDNIGYAGKDGDYWYYATNMMFDQTTLSSLRTKVSNGVTVTGLTLTVYCSKSMTGETLIGYKYNSTASGSGSSGAWTRCKNDGTSGAGSESLAFKINAQTLSTGTQTFNLYRTDPDTGTPRPYSGIPQYGLVAGPQTNVNGRWRFSSATLYVTTNEFTVNYYKGSNGTGNNITNAVIASGGSLLGATYTRTGYTQTGWSTSDGGAKVYNLSATYSGPSDVLNLYPYWTAVTYTVTYNKGTADGATGSQQTDTKTYGVDLTLKNAIFTRTGYTQQGWSTASAGNSKAYELGSNGGKYTNNADTTLYPYWVANTYAVTYNANGGSGTTASQTKTYGQPLPLRANGFTRTGYAFQHWNTKADGTGTTYAAGASYTANAAVTLYAIWLATASTVSTTNGTLGTAQTITITRSSSSYTHNLSCTYGTQTITDFATDVGTSCSWTPPPSLAAGFPNATSGTCTITCVTKSGGTTIGTTTTTCTLTIPDTADYKPSVSTFTATHHSSNSAVNAASWGGAGIYTKGYSYATLSVANGYTLKGGATLKSIVFSGPGVTAGSGTSTSTNTSVLTAPYPNNSCTWTVVVTDSRNRTASKTVSVTVYDYAPPTVSGITVHRCNADGTINDSGGEYLWIKPTFSLSSVNSKNSWSSRTLKYTLHGSSASLGSKSCTSGTEYKPTGTQWSVALTNAYDVTVTVVDAVQAADGNNTTLTVTLPTVQGLWFGKGNDRLGLGGVPEGPGLYCDWDATFKGVVDVVPRRCYATLSSAGWYRVCKTADVSGTIIDFSIGRPYGSTPAEAHRISFYVVGGGKSAFLNETSDTNTLFVDKIRCTYGGGFMYFDVHYNSSASNEVLVYFDVYGKGQANGTSVSMGLTSVADSPSGETVLTEYTFAANTNVARTAFTPTFSGTANPSVSNTACFYSIKDGVMYAGGRFNLASFTSGSTTVLFTLPVSLGIADRGAETIGTVFTTTKTLQLRSYGADVYITDAGGNYSGGLLNTGYWSFQIVAPIYN